MKNTFLIFQFLIIFSLNSFSQNSITWSNDGNGYYVDRDNSIFLKDIASEKETLLVDGNKMIPAGKQEPIQIKSYQFSKDNNQILIFTNTKRVWRYETKGDYYVYDKLSNALKQIGSSLPEASLMFAKFSPDGKKVAYVSNRNLYVEDLATSKIEPLTFSDPNKKVINGTFDWAYEEEFHCLDGFRWSGNNQDIAYWQIDATKIRDFYMINNTDSIYSYIIPIEYPKVGESPSACRIGVVNINDKQTKWMNVPGDNQQHYIPRMEWNPDYSQLILEQLNRHQNQAKLFYCNPKTGEATQIYEESDPAWVDVRISWSDENPNGWQFINGGKDFLWFSEKGGWNQVYKISSDGKKQTLLTKENFDVIDPVQIVGSTLYFYASPNNSTEQYLYQIDINGSGNAKKVFNNNQVGYHKFWISPNGKYARHYFSNYYTRPIYEWLNMKTTLPVNPNESVALKFKPELKEKSNVEFFSISTDDGVTMEGWMAKPSNFDPTKKYPVLFYVYSEPAGQTTINRWGVGQNSLYNGSLADDGYIYISVDGRGSPAPKGREWRKSIYKKIGIINIRDQAMACKKLIELNSFIDPSRIAVHGWSGGGSTTLNLLFQYPDLYQTGIAVAAVGNQLSYDNIYQERYMGVPPTDLDGFIQGSPITHAKNLKGNLLYIHGTGDDNVHYQNAELLINELVKYNKQFQLMSYPNRSHGIYEGEGTRKHLNTLFTKFLKENCEPGPK